MSSAPQIDCADQSKGSEEIVSAACDVLLEQIATKMEPKIRKAADALYADMLDNVQTYLIENANWNLSGEIRRNWQTTLENRELTQKLATSERRVSSFERYASIKELYLTTLSDGRVRVQDRECRLPGHSFPDEATARTFALGCLYGLNPRAMPEEISIVKIDATLPVA